MDMSALPKTNYIKSIVTSECKMDMERKGVQSYQSQLYVRFLCFETVRSPPCTTSPTAAFAARSC